MDELINLVVQKTGIPQDKAKLAVDTVVNFLKTKLPSSVSGQIDGLLAGGGLPDNLTKGLGGLFGSDKKP